MSSSSPDRFVQSSSPRPSPLSTPACWHALQAQLLPQDLLHDLVRPAAYRAQAGVAAGALDPVLLHVAGAAEDLRGVVGLLESAALGQELGHRDLLHGVLARVVEP